MVRQRSQSAWVRAFLGAADWASREAGTAARSSAEADEREIRIVGLSKVVANASNGLRNSRGDC